MKFILFFITLVFFCSCQVTETINLNPDGSGTIEVDQLRDENSYMQVAAEQYSKEEVFQDTTFVFKEYMTKYNDTFLKYPAIEQQLLQKYADVQLHLKASSYEKEFRTSVRQKFNKASDILDLYKAASYADKVKNNYPLEIQKEYYDVRYTFDGKVFKRLVSITNPGELQKTKEYFDSTFSRYVARKLTQVYVLQYHFPRKIISFSNPKGVVSSDKRTMRVEFLLSDCVQNPEMTNLEVVLE